MLPRTRHIYFRMEVCMLDSMLRHLKRPLIGTKQAFYMFNEEQKKSLSSLRDSIDRGDKKVVLVSKVDEFLNTLYFAETSLVSMVNSFSSSLCAFLAGTLVDSKSTWRKIALFPPIIAKVQFMLRLLAVRKFRVKFNKAILANSTEKEEAEALILLVRLAPCCTSFTKVPHSDQRNESLRDQVFTGRLHVTVFNDAEFHERGEPNRLQGSKRDSAYRPVPP